ncbi:MAG: Nif3-like dinuclear metal center hexameric protein [Candidatus Hydrogenedentes bacterium]|nr:Nif3-like dinuclear metal center hexameric protein [Candidatus Hydrogenedentota bacterium]
MRTCDIARILDREFRIEETADPEMTKHALSDFGRARVLPAFHERKTGLLFDFADSVDMTYCVTFTTTETLRQVLKLVDGPSLIFTHHPFDYHEDERGLSKTDDTLIQELDARHIAVYAIHAPLDVGRGISVSKSLAQRIGLSHAKPFFPACGGHLGILGRMEADSLGGVGAAVGHVLSLDSVDLFDNGGRLGLTAVVAGGGDQMEILKAAIEAGCTTYVTGTAVHRWARAQKGNEEFRQAARDARVNLIGGTHYNTEKWAVRDVATFLTQNGVPACFLEDPILARYDLGNFRIT